MKKIIEHFAKTEQLRLRVLKKHIQTLTPTVKRQGNLRDLITMDEKNYQLTSNLSEETFEMRYYFIEKMLSIAYISFSNEESQKEILRIFSRAIHPNHFENFTIDNEYGRFWHEGSPIKVDKERIETFMLQALFNPKEIGGNHIAAISYSELTKQHEHSASVGYLPYNRSLGTSKQACTINITSPAIKVLSQDIISLDDEYVLKWLEYFFKIGTNQTWEIVNVLGYLDFPKTVENWIPILKVN